MLIPSRDGAIELLQLFDDCLDLSEPDSQGWEIFHSIADDEVDSEKHAVTCIISFFFQKYRVSIMDGCYYQPPIRHLMWLSIFSSNAEGVQLLLDLDPQKRPLNNLLSLESSQLQEPPLVFDVVEAPEISTDILRILMDKGADIHAIYHGETPTSLSLYFSYAFLRWFDRLQDIYPNLDDFIASETMTTCILERSGWHAGALRTLFSIRLYENRHYTVEYSDVHIFYLLKCEKHGLDSVGISTDWALFIEPWWEELKYNIKSKQCICSMLEGGMYLDERCSQNHATCEEDFQTMPNVQPCKRNGDSPWVLEEFYRRGGVWQFHYEPGEIWCQECLAEREGFDKSASENTDTESSDDDADEESSDIEEGKGDDDASDISLD